MERDISLADADQLPQWAKGYVATAIEKGVVKGVSDWSKGYIGVALDEGLVKGDSNNMFLPESYATRAECAAMIVRMLNKMNI